MILGKTAEGKNLKLDLPRLIESRLLLQANSGGGKSWVLRRILEQTHGQVQQIVIDVEDEFSTLRESFDYVLAGSAGADCPAEPRSAALLARRLLELNASAIVGIYELKAHDRIRFVRLFLDALVNAPRNLWHPALIVVDEAHIFAPQVGEAESRGAVIDLMTRGRKRGFCGVLATQRISKLHKDAAAEANNKLIGRSALDVDMKRAADELGFAGREDQARLRTLEPGQFFCFGPALASTVTAVRVGSVETSHPRAGQRAAAPPPPRDKVKKVLAQLADLPREASEELATMEGLRARVRELEGQLRKAPAAAPKVEIREVPVITDAQIDRLESALARHQKVITGSKIEIDDLSALLRKAAGNVGPKALPAPATTHRVPAAAAPRPSAPPTDGLLTAPRQRILDALAWLEGIRVLRADRTQLAFLADQSPTSSGYTNNLGALRSAGLIEYPTTGEVVLTASGREAAAAPTAPATTEELQRSVLAKLPAPRARIIQALIGSYPESMSREDLAAASGQSITSSGFTNNLGALRSLGLLDYPTTGYVVASNILFLN